MEHRNCACLLPSHDIFHVPPDTMPPECLLKEHHDERHLCRLYNGRFLRWEPDDECTTCEETYGYCDCYVSDEISEVEAKKMIEDSFKAA